MTNTKSRSDVFFRKASELKPLKHLQHSLDTSASCKLKDNSAANYKRGISSQKVDQWLNKSSTLKQNEPAGRKDNHERRRSAEGSSHGNHGNISPGDPAGVKDVANVVVKYLSPYLKQGSIVSKVIKLCMSVISDCYDTH